MSDDLILWYSGGSGGFILLHLLLLSGEFYSYIDEGSTLDEIIQKQWNILDHNIWKSTEQWPINTKTAESKSNLRKLYFFCSDSIDLQCKGKVLVCYTDVQSQVELAKYKNAYWFFNNRHSSSFFIRLMLNQWKKFYNDIKDPLWPACNNPNKISHLPKEIQDEIVSNPYYDIILSTKTLPSWFLFNDAKVYSEVYDLISTADIIVKLQDVINYPEITLKRITNKDINSRQIDLINHWKSKHPPELLKKIGITP